MSIDVSERINAFPTNFIHTNTNLSGSGTMVGLIAELHQIILNIKYLLQFH